MLLLLLLPAAELDAQASTPPLSQWHHTSWTGSAGPPRTGTYSILRGPDGYLWLSAFKGLLRFDGIRFTVFDSTNTQAFHSVRAQGFANFTSQVFYPALVDDSAALWIKGPGGAFIRYRDGRFQQVRKSVERGHGGNLARGLGGMVFQEGGTIRRYRNGNFERLILPRAAPDTGIWDTHPDTAKGLLIGTWSQGLWHVFGDSARRIETPTSGSVRPLLQSRDGSYWALGSGFGTPGVFRYARGRWTPLRLPGDSTSVLATTGFEGRDGWVWFPTRTMGIVRWRDGVIEQFGKRDGLSSDRVDDVMMDPEGAVWAVTDVGLDRLRPSAFVTIDQRDGLPYSAAFGYVEDVDGSLWAQSPDGSRLFRLDGGVIRKQSGPINWLEYRVDQGRTFVVLTPSGKGGVWLATRSGQLIHLRKDGRTVYGTNSGLPGRAIGGGWEARDGTLWLYNNQGMFAFRNGRYTPVPLGRGINTVWFKGEDARGRLWVVPQATGRILIVAGDTIEREVQLPQFVVGNSTLAAENKDVMWGTSFESLHRIRKERAIDVRVPALAELLAPGADVTISGGYVWLGSSAGIAKVPLAALNRAAEGDTATIIPTLFSELDGLSFPGTARVNLPRIQTGRDGRVWVPTTTGLAVTDPANDFRNPTPPVVHIEEIMLGGERITLDNGGAIPPNPGRIAIHFTATSSVLPERVRIQYRLEGADESWIDAGLPRRATYNQLRPGRYQFRVRAWNEDGVAGRDQAALSFRVLPAWYQSWWFFGLCVLAVAGAGSMIAISLQRNRTRRSTERMEAHYQAVLAERTRIARELHDTLLQGFTGITLQLEGLRSRIAQRPGDSAQELSTILRGADQALREAREMVWDMRSPELTSNDLGGALEEAGRRALNGDSVDLRCVVEGTRRRLPPVIETTVLRVSREAVANALKHADPRCVQIVLSYEPRHIQLRISDDGRGADPEQFDVATSAGHWGVAGMRERALRAGGTLTVHTARGQGTRIDLMLPAEPIP